MVSPRLLAFGLTLLCLACANVVLAEVPGTFRADNAQPLLSSRSARGSSQSQSRSETQLKWRPTERSLARQQSQQDWEGRSTSSSKVREPSSVAPRPVASRSDDSQRQAPQRPTLVLSSRRQAQGAIQTTGAVEELHLPSAEGMVIEEVPRGTSYSVQSQDPEPEVSPELRTDIYDYQPVTNDKNPCPRRDQLKRIGQININIRAEGTDFPNECPLFAETYQPRSWTPTTYTWKASALCHKPLYFEDVALERYGHTWGLLQPVVSGAHFFAALPLLPYKMGVDHPHECIYALGYYRPGSCAPYHILPFPISPRGAAYEGLAATGLVYLLP